MSFLEEIVDWTEQAVAERKAERSLQEIRAALPSPSAERPFLQALRGPDISLIAEFKRSSPSHAGPPRANPLVETVEKYERGGASALSILTEKHCFHGSLMDLREARSATRLPLLRKDFIIDEYQVYEAAEIGADAVLLIAAVLGDDGRLSGLYSLARELGLDVLLEIRDAPELQRALALGADVIGVNNRDLKTHPSTPRDFEVDTTRTLKLFDEIPSSVTVVAESGLERRAELDELQALGVRAALIGSALMDAPDPEAKCRELTLASGVSPLSRPADHPAFA
jgi:indole-3-glycerol phosphate synthase